MGENRRMPTRDGRIAERFVDPHNERKKMHERTKDAIDKMTRAGFKQSEFSVRLDANYRPQITMKASLERLYELLPETISQRLTVRLWYTETKTIIGYEIGYVHYGRDPHLLIEPYSFWMDDGGECLYCKDQATIWDEDVPWCESCFDRHN